MYNSTKLVKYARTLCPANFDDMTHEEATTAYERAEAMVLAINEWFAGVREEMGEYVKRQPGECVPVATADGTRYYVVKTDKRKKLRADRTPELLELCLEHLTVDNIADCLSSNAFKPAALASLLDGSDQFFEVIESEKPSLRKTPPPAFKKRLQAMDAAIVREGGGA